MKTVLIPAMGFVGGALGILLDRKEPVRGLVVGAVTGASLAVFVTCRTYEDGEGVDLYSASTRFYGEEETEAGV